MEKANLTNLRGNVFYLVMLLLFLFPSHYLLAQSSHTVTGIVKDEKGVPIANISVIVKGTTFGTTTDALGKYSISVPGPKSILVISSAGYQSREMVVGERQSLDASLKMESKTLNEVLVTGY